MLGLSITAIGLRPIDECLAIWQKLRQSMELDFLELAIGSACDRNLDYLDIPLVIHDSCLYEGRMRHRLDIFTPQTWLVYREFISSHDVRAVSLHPPLKKYCSQKELEVAMNKMEHIFKIPVYLEIMPDADYWCSSIETLIDFPLLLDVSHVNIWHRGNLKLTQETCLSLLQSHPIKAIHLSHNQGKRDSHDLIPQSIWFDSLIDEWQKQYLVTYESLPANYGGYERLDKQTAFSKL